ncbi:1362_t:CDS:1, partial [Acaulospora colombiana]
MEVGDLKKKILEENHNTLAGIDAPQLILYRVKLPDDSDLAKNVQEYMSTNPDPAQSSTELHEIYPSIPPKRTVHFIVQLPP